MIYKKLIRSLLKVSRKLNIIIVGANDGKINDPSYDLILKNAVRIDVLLIEPNASLLPFLKENYSPHPSHKIVNCAIGGEGILQFFVVKEDYWKNFQPSYAKGWPIYRAATGISSSTRSHVEDALVREGINPKEAIEVINVPFKKLDHLCHELCWKTPIDILQIDVEGHDDSVIYTSNLEQIRPKIIYFEIINLTEPKREALTAYLSKKKYKVYDLGGNSLAVDSRIRPICIYLRIIMLNIVILATTKRLYCKLSSIIANKTVDRNSE